MREPRGEKERFAKTLVVVVVVVTIVASFAEVFNTQFDTYLMIC